MSRLEFLSLSQDSEIDHFLECFKKYVNVKLPAAYAKSGDVIGVFKGGEMIGGYMLITKGPFRSMAFVPDEIKKNLPTLRECSRTDFVEVNGFWVSEAYRRSHESLQMWLKLRKDILATKASYLLLFYNAQAKGLSQFYEKAMNPRLVYRGKPMENATATTSYAEVTISMVSRLDVRLCLYRGISHLLSKRMLKIPSKSLHSQSGDSVDGRRIKIVGSR